MVLALELTQGIPASPTGCEKVFKVFCSFIHSFTLVYFPKWRNVVVRPVIEEDPLFSAAGSEEGGVSREAPGDTVLQVPSSPGAAPHHASFHTRQSLHCAPLCHYPALGHLLRPGVGAHPLSVSPSAHPVSLLHRHASSLRVSAYSRMGHCLHPMRRCIPSGHWPCLSSLLLSPVA